MVLNYIWIAFILIAFVAWHAAVHGVAKSRT